MDKKKALQDLPGAAIDKADGCKAGSEEVKEEIRDLNNNPRNDDDRMP